MNLDIKERESQPEFFQKYISEKTNELLTCVEYGGVTGVGGLSLATVHVKPLVASRHQNSATIVLVPGRTESFLKYAELISDLTTAGHEVFSMDHRGQGLSERLLAHPQIGFVSDFSDYQADLQNFFANVVERKRSFSSCYIVAHSMGAAIMLNMVLDAQDQWRAPKQDFLLGKVSGLILSAPMLAIRLSAPQLLTEAVVGLRCLFGKAKSFAVQPGELDTNTYGDDLTHSSMRLQWYRELLTRHPEIQLGMPSNQWLREALRFTRELRDRLKKASLRCPVLLLTPGRDSVVEVDVQQLITAPYDGALLERLQLPHAAHDPFLEIDAIRALVVDRILDFVSASP